MNLKIPAKTWINPKIEIRVTKDRGKGMFATEDIKEGEEVIIWGGTYVNTSEAQKSKELGKLVMQWDEDLWSIEDRGEDEGYFINHSCNPNTWMKDAITLIAMRDIQIDEELTADYVIWESEENYISKWECHCGSDHCRHRITGIDWKINEIQERYNGHFSPLLNKRIGKLNKK